MSEGGGGFLDKVKGVIKRTGKNDKGNWIPIDVDQAIKDKAEKDKIAAQSAVSEKNSVVAGFTPIDMPKADVVSGFAQIDIPAGESVNIVTKSGLEGVVIGDNEKVIVKGSVVSGSDKIVAGDLNKIIVKKEVKPGLEGVVIGNNKEVIKNSSAENLIDPELVDVLSRVPQEVPEEFKDSLVKVATWWTRLDRGDRSVLDDQEAKNWLLRFLGNTAVDTHRDNAFAYLKENLPWWLRKAFTGEFAGNSDRDIEDEKELNEAIKTGFIDWGKSSGYESIVNSRGTFYVIKETKEENKLSRADSFKVYLEGARAKKALEGSWETALKSFEDKGPDQVKYFGEGAIVLYFDDKRISGDEVVEKFRNGGVEVSDWVSDVCEFDENGTLRFINTNDSSVRSMEYPERYESGDMFKKYVDYCLKAARKPDNPTRAAFVRARCEKGEEKEKVLLSVVYSKEELRLKDG